MDRQEQILSKRTYHRLYYHFLNARGDIECECGSKMKFYYSVYGKHNETRKHKAFMDKTVYLEYH